MFPVPRTAPGLPEDEDIQQDNDGDRNAYQPQQKPFTHLILLAFVTNVIVTRVERRRGPWVPGHPRACNHADDGG